MAGKSTFLKAMALAVFLAHLGCGVPATAMDFPVVGTVFSSVHIVDNLSAGESFYLAEVRRMRALALALSEHQSVFAVVDEPFRGTNVHDAAEATVALRLESTVEELIRTIHAHPTFAEAIGEAAHAAHGAAIHS
jgi:DNA mismatch repair ATPase MutS